MYATVGLRVVFAAGFGGFLLEQWEWQLEPGADRANAARRLLTRRGQVAEVGSAISARSMRRTRPIHETGESAW